MTASPKRKTIEIPAKRYEGYDDCLSAAQADYAEVHGLQGWDLSPRWADDERDTILLDVPSDVVTIKNSTGKRGGISSMEYATPEAAIEAIRTVAGWEDACMSEWYTHDAERDGASVYPDDDAREADADGAHPSDIRLIRDAQ